MEEYTTYWLLFRGLRQYYGILWRAAYRESAARYKRSRTNSWYCDICGEPIVTRDKATQESATIDHVIPKNIIWELEHPGLFFLIFDHRNFRLCHQRCNIARGLLTINDLPPRIRNKLFALTEEQTRLS